jgi:hypothetical protein
VKVNEPGARKYPQILAIRLTPQQREEVFKNVRKAGYPTVAAAFMNFVKKEAAENTYSLTATEREYEATYGKCKSIVNRLGMRKMTILAGMYRQAARDMGYEQKYYGRPLDFPDDYGRIVTLVFRRAMEAKDTDSKIGIETLDLLQMRELFAAWKYLNELERRMKRELDTAPDSVHESQESRQ